VIDLPRDELGRWTDMPLEPPPEGETLSEVRLWNVTEIREEFDAKHRQNEAEYNKFIAWENGMNVAPNFPFDVRVCVTYSPQKYDRYDFYRFDPMPKDFVLQVVENPMKEPNPELAKFSKASFILKVGKQHGFTLTADRFETFYDAYDELRRIRTEFIIFCADHKNVSTDRRKMMCPKCKTVLPLSDYKTRPDTPATNISLEPVKLYDTMKFHDCGKVF
jgi:hypothetical protein